MENRNQWHNKGVEHDQNLQNGACAAMRSCRIVMNTQ